MADPQLISENYLELNKRLHDDREDYGTSGHHYAELVSGLAASMGTNDLLDYGAGKQTLANALPQFGIKAYDPAVESISATPEPAELVICTDVLEHIEPDCLDAVLDDLLRVTKKLLIATVATRPAVKTLADGRNAHLIVEDFRWWMPKFWDRFVINQVQNMDNMEILLIAQPREDEK